METTENPVKRKIILPLLIILLTIILILAFALGYLLLKDKEFFDIKKILNSENENTILLNEFVVNINSNNDRRSYLKVEIALMYNDKKDGELIESNINKIRDIIINNLMYKSSDDILNVENIKGLKDELKSKINDQINDEVVKDLYITNLVIQ